MFIVALLAIVTLAIVTAHVWRTGHRPFGDDWRWISSGFVSVVVLLGLGVLAWPAAPTTTTTTTTTTPPATTTTTTTTAAPATAPTVGPGLGDPYADVFGSGWKASLGADLPGVSKWRDLHVDNAHPTASDSNDGTAASPLLTVTEALKRAHSARKSGLDVRVLVHPGTYRERLEIAGGAGSSNEPVLRLEAVKAGSVVISGSDIYTGWQPVAGTGISYHDWPHNWGLTPIPSGWGSVSVKSIVRRKEMVFVDGDHHSQVLSYDKLVPGSFYVAEAEDRLYVYPSGSTDLSSRTVEVGIRPEALRLQSVRNVVVDGLVFQHATSTFRGGAVFVAESN
ncbi:MAG: hypothetical protein ACYSVY_25785, partial [Planctomycetota bacterium]